MLQSKTESRCHLHANQRITIDGLAEELGIGHERALKMLSPEFFLEGLLKPMKRYDKCLNVLGTCINNTSVMMFKKGSFEVGGVIYPAAIKYDPRFGDPFWNSSKQGYMHYLLMMMSSWAIVCDVWYLPPMHREEGESSIDFAKRVKAAISKQGGLVDLEWDGQLKRMQVKKEWKELQQQEYSQRILVGKSNNPVS
ncbi:glycerol-3-phosphate acyltransferase 3-like [Trichonephila clavipes]|nr:glycerol-3-phosphate acyltransferase 3-like [Trichonephila clavipes]